MRAIGVSVHAPLIVLLLTGCTAEPKSTSPQSVDSQKVSMTQASELAEHAAPSSGLKPIDAAALQATISAAAKEMLIPGAVVLLRTPQGEFAVNYGTTELGVTTPPNAETHFRIASNTKTMTATVILQLVQEGKLKLDEPISKFVPGVPDGELITIAELLEMRSGLYNYTNSAEFASQLDHDPGKAWTTEELLALAFKHPSPAKPGAEFEYCNTNYALLGLVIEKVDGRPLAAAMHERLFKPLGMTNTLLPTADSNKIPAPFSHGYLYGSTSVALFGTPSYTPEMVA
ncbi:MAG: beta-lactamase family protein, partial [Pirellulales bacterium]|nr:beta-lactamase family protein [Pirellulales bacterium]